MNQFFHINYVFVITHLIVAALMFAWGVMVVWKQVFPYQLLSAVYSSTSSDLPLSNRARIELFTEFEVEPEIIMLGDSITRGGEWAEFLGFVPLLNRGIDADTTERVLFRLSEVKEKRAEVVVIMLGINDIFQGVPLRRIEGRYSAIVEDLRSSGADVVIMATLHCSTRACKASHNAQVSALNRYLLKLAETEQLEFVDLNPVLASDGALLSEFTYDGIHLTAPAYRVWVDALRPLVVR